MEKLKCPICGKEFKSLLTHLIYIHNLTREEIKEKYKDIKLHIDTRNKNEVIKCEICGKEFKTKNACTVHFKYIHKDLYKKIEKKERTEGIKCEICGKIYNNISQHLKVKHNITIEEYRIQYNYTGPTAYFSKTHKENLSKNKINFYDSNEGIIWKKENSKRTKGEKNPGCRKDVKEKISKSALNRIKNNQNDSFFSNSYGIIVKFIFNNISYKTRSFEEFKVLYTLLKNNIDFQYEKNSIKYEDNDGVLRNYLLDIKVGNKLIEIKGNSERSIYEYEYNKETYKAIIKILKDCDKEFYIVNYKMFCSLFNIKEIHNNIFYKEIKNMLDNNMCYITQTVINRNIKPRTLLKIDKDYINNKNIKFIIKGDKHGI